MTGRPHAPPHLAEAGGLEIVEHNAPEEDIRIAVEAIPDALDRNWIVVTEVDPFTLTREEPPVDRPVEALDDSGVIVAVYAHE